MVKKRGNKKEREGREGEKEGSGSVRRKVNQVNQRKGSVAPPND